MAFCMNCGNEVPDGTKFCPNCGTQVGSSVTPDRVAEVQNVQQQNREPVTFSRILIFRSHLSRSHSHQAWISLESSLG